MRARSGAMELIGALMVLSLVAVAAAAPILAPHDPARAVAPTYGEPAPPSRAFPFGTDELGRDVLSRIIFGARVSLIVGVAGMLMTMTIGVAIGLAAGFFRGATDFVLMRFTDVMLTLPALLLAMALVAVLGPSLVNILIVIGLVSWTQVARVVRAEALSVSQRDFVRRGALAGRLSAAPDRASSVARLLPLIVVMAALSTSGTLLLDAGLSFLGLGVPPPTPSWGRMIAGGRVYLPRRPMAGRLSGPGDFLRSAGLQPLRLRLPPPAEAMNAPFPITADMKIGQSDSASALLKEAGVPLAAKSAPSS